MAIYEFEALYTYAAAPDDSLSSLGIEDLSGTISDGEADSTLSSGDTVDIASELNNTQTVDVYGIYTAGSGTDYLVLTDGQLYYVASPQSVDSTGNDLPSSISLTDIDTSEALVVCFAAGSLISVPGGETRVEDLKIGDMVLTAEGASVPVKWVGRRRVSKLFTPADRLRPVRVSSGALGNGLPHTDLILTADHALIIDGLAINAAALINGTTIRFEPMDRLPDQFTYFHVETEDHNVILANGAPAETYIDYIARSAFDNHEEYLELYGAEKVIDEMPLPRISAARMLPDAIRAKLQGAKAA